MQSRELLTEQPLIENLQNVQGQVDLIEVALALKRAVRTAGKIKLKRLVFLSMR